MYSQSIFKSKSISISQLMGCKAIKNRIIFMRYYLSLFLIDQTLSAKSPNDLIQMIFSAFINFIAGYQGTHDLSLFFPEV